MKTADDASLALTQLVVSRRVTAQEVVEFVTGILEQHETNENYSNAPFMPIAMTAAALERSDIGDFSHVAANLWRLAGFFAAAQFIFDMKRSLGLLPKEARFDFSLGADDFTIN